MITKKENITKYKKNPNIIFNLMTNNDIKTLFSIKVTLRVKGDRQHYFPIKKAYIDDEIFKVGTRYRIYIEEISKEENDSF